MDWGIFTVALVGVLVLLLVSAGVEDARTREIANWKNAAIALLAPVYWWSIGMPVWPDVALQLGIAIVVFGAFCGAFALGMMGGGDVKMIAALALWLTPRPLIWMLLVMSLVGGALTLVMLVEHRLRKRPVQLEIPYGVAIAIAALLAIHEPNFNHLG